MIRILMVDDSPLALHIMQHLLGRAPDIQVVGTAQDGREALSRVDSLKPDVVCLDLNMPVMDGLEFTRRVMATSPRPILVVSGAVEPGTSGAFKLLEAGAVDVMSKPAVIQLNDNKLATDLITKIRLVAGVKVFRRPPSAAASSPPVPNPPSPPAGLEIRPGARLVVMGASTGGPEALRQILAGLPSGFPMPVVCVQHIGREFLAEMVAWLANYARLGVAQARSGEAPMAGRVYFAPAVDAHLEFDGRGRFLLTHGPACDGHRPSVTVTMAAAARQFGASTVGVLLTGMGRDGAAGLAAIARAGGLTIAQDETTSVIYGMPREAVALGAARHILPLGQIAHALESAAGVAGRATSKS